MTTEDGWPLADGMKRCGYGKGHVTTVERFYANARTADGKNGICIYHQGMVDARKR